MRKLQLVLGFLLICMAPLAYAQNMGINADGAAPDGSAMLDVVATDKGLLIPRMTEAQKNAISNPATSLIIYQTDGTVGFYFNAGTPGTPSWIRLTSTNDAATPIEVGDADNDTKIQVEESADEDIIRFDIGGTERLVLTGGRIEQKNTGGSVFLGENAGANNDLVNDRHVFIGFNAGASLNSSGQRNIAIGDNAMGSSTSSGGADNIALGYQAGQNITSGQNNISIGKSAGKSITGGENNLLVGQLAGQNISAGDENVILGSAAGYALANRNVAVGSGAGQNATGSFNVFLGYLSGRNESGDNKLYIENTSSATPLIYGDFANDSLKVYGTLSVGDNFTFPNTDGTNGQVLQTDGSGNVSWGSVSSSGWGLNGNAVSATDFLGTTNTQPLRFSTNSTERMQINSSGGLGIGASALTTTGLRLESAFEFGQTINQNYNGANAQRGLSININNAGTGTLFGLTSTVTPDASNSSSAAGMAASVNANGSGAVTGFSSNIQGSGTGLRYGFASSINNNSANTGQVYGLRSDIENEGSGSTFGAYTVLDGSGDGLQSVYHSVLNTTGNGENYGFYTVLSGSGSGANYGMRVIHNAAGTGTEYGVYIENEDINYFSGKLGIGTSTPDSLFEVAGGATIDRLNINSSFTFPNTDGTNSQVLQTDGSGNVSWQSIASGGNTLDAAYDQGGSGAGRTITADNGAVRIAGTDGLTVTGAFGSGDIVAVSGAGQRMFYNPRTGAFRAGTASGTEWDASNLGANSVAMGSNATATGTTSISLGTATNASASNAVVLGYNSNASATQASALGSNNTSSGLGAMAMGSGSTASGNYSNTLGFGVLSRSQGEVALGVNNTDYTPNSTSSYNSNDRLLVIGNGSSTSNRSDALTILKSGKTYINNTLTLSNGSDSITFPNTDGTNGQVLQTDGSGNVSWGSISGADDLGNHTATTNLNLNGNYLSGDGGSEGIHVDADGDVTIGSNKGFRDFSVWGENGTGGIDISFWSEDAKPEVTYGAHGSGSSSGTEVSFFKARGTWLSQSAVANGDNVLKFNTTLKYDATNSIIDNFFSLDIDGTPSGSTVPTSLKFYTVNPAGFYNSLVMLSSGNVGVGTTTPDSLLDVDGGATIDRLNINSRYTFPDSDGTNGQVLQTDGGGNVSWASVSGGSSGTIEDADGDTKIQVEESADDDIIRFDINGKEHFAMYGGRLQVFNTGESVFIGESAGNSDDLTSNSNTFVGYYSGLLTNSGSMNTAIGAASMLGNSSGSENTAVGVNSLDGNGSFNVAIGRYAMGWGDGGSYNTVLGHRAMMGGASNKVTGNNNVAIGASAGDNVTGGSNNVFIGKWSGFNSVNANNNVFIGNESGYSVTGSDLLYIENSNSSTPLIWGDFANDSLKVNGNLSATNGLQVTSGNVGIGTSSPNGLLDVNGTILGNAIALSNSSSTGQPTLWSASNSTGQSILFKYTYNAVGNIPANTWQFRSSGSSRRDIVFSGVDSQVSLFLETSASGNVGIGTTSPSTELEVDGTVTINDELNSDATGSFNLMPLAMVNASSAGTTIYTSTGNVSVNKVSTGIYEVTVTGHTASLTANIAFANAKGNAGNSISLGTSSGSYQINVFDTSGNRADGGFMFMVYAP